MLFGIPEFLTSSLIESSIAPTPLSLSVGISAAAHGQASPPHKPSTVRCPSPADPRNLHFECAGRSFDMIEETLTKDWAGLRTDLSELGIKPTASYTTDLLGNPAGGQSRGFTYSGTVQVSIFWDFAKLLHLAGLSFNIGGAWSTGKNLSADHIGNNFWVQSAYTAPGNGAITSPSASCTCSSNCLTTH